MVLFSDPYTFALLVYWTGHVHDSLYPCNSYIMLVEMYFDEDALVLHVWMCIFAYFDTYALWRSSAPF